eukprot:2217947-Pleurochrysis_carterae.AAC.14
MLAGDVKDELEVRAQRAGDKLRRHVLVVGNIELLIKIEALGPRRNDAYFINRRSDGPETSDIADARNAHVLAIQVVADA